MSYTIRKFNGTELVVLGDGTIDTSTSVALVGRNYTGYGELQNENFLFLLENFANDAPPPRPVVGQTWFSTLNNNLQVYDGQNWTLVGTAVVSSVEPEQPPVGSLWFNSDEQRLYCWTGQWVFVGPETSPGFSETRARSSTLLSDTGERYPVILMYVNDSIESIFSSSVFTISSVERPEGFTDLIAGLNFPNRGTQPTIKGRLEGSSTQSTRLETPRLINGIGFNGTQDINITATTPFNLTRGDYLVGSNFNGSSQVTWRVDATPNNTIGTVVARDSAGDFSAGTITASLIGNVQGNVNVSVGTSIFNRIEANEIIGRDLSGNANTATRLRTARTINGVSFDGTQNVTVPVSGENVTGSRLANNIVNSNLSTLGTLTELFVDDSGIKIGNNLNFFLDSGVSTIEADNASGLTIKTLDASVVGNYSQLSFLSAATNLLRGGDNTSAFVPGNNIDLGSSYNGFNKVYANQFVGTFQGTSTTASSATTAVNLAGGASGSIPYQTATGTTSFVPPGSSGQVLRSAGSGQPTWGSITFSTLTRGLYLTGSNYDGITNTTWSVDASSSNVANKIVARDSSGNFSAGTITATLNGNITGNANTVSSVTSNQVTTALGYTPARNSIITTFENGFFGSLNNSGNLNITKPNPTIFLDNSLSAGIEIAISVQSDPGRGDSLLIYSPERADQIWFQMWGDNRGQLFGKNIYTDDTLKFTYGKNDVVAYSSQVGSFNLFSNYFDVFPPAGYTLSSLVAFIPSINTISFAGAVNGDDILRCTYNTRSGDRMRVFVGNSEQRNTPSANWVAIWRR